MQQTDQPGIEVARHQYGADPSQYGELYLPSGPRMPGTVVVIHGGFWRSRYAADLGAPLAADLAARGWAAWNLEYRRVGNGGGWPATFADVATGIDLLADLTERSGNTGMAGLDLDRVVAIGHSAGGHLATWAAGRPGLPEQPGGAAGATPEVRLTGVLAQAAVLDLPRAAADRLGGAAVSALLGGLPHEVPERYRLADPRRRLPLDVPVRCLHSRDDGVVPFDQSTGYVSAAQAAGADAGLVEVTGGHFGLIDPESAAWQACVELLPQLLAH